MDRQIKWHKTIFFLIAGPVIAAYSNSFCGAFVFDDNSSIVNNPFIRSLTSLGSLMRDPLYAGISARPVVNMTFALNYAFGHLKVFGYHAVNLAIHISAALILFGIVQRTLQTEFLKKRYGRPSFWLALAIALLWALHPLQTQSVTYITQRAESLVGLFYLLTLYCFTRSNECARARLWQIGSLIFCALGMATKQVMVSAPLVILLYDYIFISKSLPRIFRERMRFYAGLAATWGILALLNILTAMQPKATAGFSFKGITPLQYALIQPSSILHYLRLVFWPHPLIFDYVGPVSNNPWVVFISSGILLFLAFLVLRMFRHQPALAFFGMCFFLILSPTSSFIPVKDLVVEHRMYLPLAVVIAAAVFGGYEALNHAYGKMLLEERLRFLINTILVVLIASLLGVLTFHRNKDYAHEELIWRDTIGKRPNNYRAYHNLGNVLDQQGRLDEAVHYYSKAIALKPDYALAHNNIAATLEKQGKQDEAMAHYLEADRLNPSLADTQNNLGNIWRKKGALEKAIAHYRKALAINPRYHLAHRNLGAVLLERGMVEEGLFHYQKAVELNPDWAELRIELANALVLNANPTNVLSVQGKTDDAIFHFREAARLNPSNAEVQLNLGALLAKTGKHEEGVYHLKESIRLDPHLIKAYSNLGYVLMEQGKFVESLEAYRQALHLAPDNIEAHVDLGALLVMQDKKEEGLSHFSEALRMDPGHARAHYNIGNMLAAEKRYEDAERHFAAAVRTNPNNLEARYNLGTALLAQDKFEDAIPHFEHILSLTPDDSDTRSSLQFARSRQRK